MSDFIFGNHTLGENNEKAPKKEEMPWIREHEHFKYKWYTDTDDDCAECGYSDSPCVIFGEGDFFCSEECMRIFYAFEAKWEEEQAEMIRIDEEECGPWIDILDDDDDDDIQLLS